MKFTTQLGIISHEIRIPINQPGSMDMIYAKDLKDQSSRFAIPRAPPK